MKITYFIFLIILLLQPSLVLAKNAEEVPIIQPPTLVECKSEKFCDRDPEHLEKFVSDFYKWYIASKQFTFSSALHKLPHETFIKIKQAHNKEEDNFLKKLITPDFYQWIHNVSDNKYDRAETEKYCSQDINFFTCSQDYHEEWLYETKSKLIKINNYSATIIVFLPFPLDKSLKQPSPHLILVEVEVIEGNWRISGTDLIFID